jgi:hypothetical protein
MHLTESTAVGTLLRASRYTLARLRARSETRKLILDLKPVHTALKSAQLALADAEDHRIDMRADFDEAAEQGRAAVTELQMAATLAVKRDFSDALYRKLFPGGLTTLKLSGNEGIRTDLPRIIEVIKSLPASHPLAAQLRPLQAAEQGWIKPAHALAAAETAQQVAEGAVVVAKQAWLDAWDGLHGSLRKQFPRQRAMVSSFFPGTRTARKAATGPTPQAQIKAA